MSKHTELTRKQIRLLRLALLNYVPPPELREESVPTLVKLEEMEGK